MVRSKFLKVTLWGRISTKWDKKLGNMIEKIWHAVTEFNVWGSNFNIPSVNDLIMWYFISLMIKVDIPYLELTYLMKLMVKTLNESAIYLIKDLTQHKMAPNMFNKWLWRFIEKKSLNLRLEGRWVGINTKIHRPFASLELARCVNTHVCQAYCRGFESWLELYSWLLILL